MSDGKLKALATELENGDLKLLKESIDELDNALSMDEFIVKAKMPEVIFKEAFLPTIAGIEKDNGVAMMKYIEYAGGPYREVDIVDKDGNTLYTCPPVYNRSVNEGNRRLPYSQISSTYELKRARMAIEANNYMHNVSVNIADSVVIEETSSEFIWGKIVDRYFKPTTTDNNASNTETNRDIIDDGFINYD